MPTIAFSDNFMSGAGSVMDRLMSYNVVTNNNNLINGLLSNGGVFNSSGMEYLRGGVISIMKGTVPTNFNSITDYSSRSADVLVQWTILNGNFPAASTTTNPAVITSSFVSAIESGTATWFWWITRGQRGGGLYNNEIFEQIAGTVDVTGSGADLEIASTSITSGQLFRLTDLRLQLATSFNY